MTLLPNMLKSTFIHLPGLGPATEQRLWQAGITTWERFLKAPTLPGLSVPRRDHLAKLLQEDLGRVDDPAYWSRVLPSSEQWRMYGQFRDRTGFLDIETDGRPVEEGGEVTMIGLYDGRIFRPFVNGRNLERFEERLGGLQVLVTFNGACFDLPVLRSYIRHLRLPPAHIDLRYPLKRLGFQGGLKRIEQAFALDRQEEIQGLDGWEAVILWRRHLNGDPRAMGTLIRYNRADTVNLKPLMDRTYEMLRQEAMGVPALFPAGTP